MKKGAIIAFLALATSVAAFTGFMNTDCCDKTACCPIGTEIGAETCCGLTGCK